MEGRLLDYLYGELEPDQRDAFERALPAFPEVQAELEQHQWTRQQMTRLPLVALPAGALDRALAEADKLAAAHAPAKLGWAERLRRLVMQPAFGVAFVALVAVGVGVTMKGGSSLAPTGDEQSISMVPVQPAQGAAAKPADESVAAAPTKTGNDYREAGVGEGAKLEEAPALAQQAPAEIASAEPAPVLPPMAAGSAQVAEARAERKAEVMKAKPQDPPVAVKIIDAPKAAAPRPLEKPSEVAGLDADGIKDAEAEAADKSSAFSGSLPAQRGGAHGYGGPDAKPVTTTAGAEERAEDGVRQGALGGTMRMPPNNYRVQVDSNGDNTVTKAEPAPEPQAAPEQPTYRAARTVAADSAVVNEERGRAPVSIDDEEQREKKVGEARLAERDDAPKNDKAKEPTKPAPAPATKTPDAPEKTNTADRASTNGNNTNARAVAEDRLWTTFGQQMAIGAYADANATLGELAKLGETPRLKTARETYKKQADAAKRAEEERLKNAPARVPPDPPNRNP